MPNAGTRWTLEDCESLIDEWIVRESPSQHRLNETWAWLQSCMDDPYDHGRAFPEPGIPGYYSRKVPATGGTDNMVVLVCYWIKIPERAIRVDMVGLLPVP